MRRRCGVPVIASGGVGTLQHFVEGARAGATGLLAASVFHFGTFTVARSEGGVACGRPAGAPAAPWRPEDAAMAKSAKSKDACRLGCRQAKRKKQVKPKKRRKPAKLRTRQSRPRGQVAECPATCRRWRSVPPPRCWTGCGRW